MAIRIAWGVFSYQEQIVAAKTPAFAVDVQALRFVNSTAIRAFVDWISRAAHAGYTLAFKTSASVTWHRLSFSVLKSLAPSTVEIVETRTTSPGPRRRSER